VSAAPDRESWASTDWFGSLFRRLAGVDVNRHMAAALLDMTGSHRSFEENLTTH
jgi:hypothetical protein